MWYKFLENTFFLKSLYNEVPELDNIEITSIQMINDGATCRVALYLPKFADTPPKKWDDSFNTVRVNLNFSDITDFQWKGWGTDIIAKLEIIKVADTFSVSITGKNIELGFTTKYIRIDSIEGFCVDRNSF